MRKHLDQLDGAVLQTVKSFFQGNQLYGDWEGLVREAEILRTGDGGVAKQVSSSTEWRARAAQALRVVVDPQELGWTNNLALSDADFARRGLQVMTKDGPQR